MTLEVLTWFVLGGAFPFRLLDAAYNLPYFHAWSILNDVLLQLAIEGHFRALSQISILRGKSKPLVAEIQWLTDLKIPEKANLRQSQLD
jgi:hypothetical protein